MTTNTYTVECRVSEFGYNRECGWTSDEYTYMSLEGAKDARENLEANAHGCEYRTVTYHVDLAVDGKDDYAPTVWQQVTDVGGSKSDAEAYECELQLDNPTETYRVRAEHVN